MKMRNICKIWFATKIFSLWKSLVYHQRAVEYGIFEFLLFPFTQISSGYCRKSYNGFWGLLVISPATQIFLIYTFVTMKRRHFYIFLKFAQICILFRYFFQNERNITTFLLVVHLKCTVLHYADLNSSSKNKPFLNYGSLNMLFRFFRFLIYVYFSETFVKILMK